MNKNQQALLKLLPGVDSVLESFQNDAAYSLIPRFVITLCIRRVIDSLRELILNPDSEISPKDLEEPKIIEKINISIREKMKSNLVPLINATGVVVHTNLGRSLLCEDALNNIRNISGSYSNLEFNIKAGSRGIRYSAVEEILCEISGAEAALVVNNNAAAVLLCLETISFGKSVIISRGELVEIGGSFRIPDVMAKSGGILKEVGTTNRTHLKDYESAIELDTGLLLKVHTSNYSIVGFTKAVPLTELVDLGERYHIPVMEDLGSGTFIDFSKYGLVKEPTVQESIASGVDVVSFSGDKLLGGPQAGIILGKKSIIDKIKKNPLTRALRIDKMTLAALESTLRLYMDEEKAVSSIPTLDMLTQSLDKIEKKAKKLLRMLKGLKSDRIKIKLLDLHSKAGGGALPLFNLPTKCLGLQISGLSANTIENSLRKNRPPIIGRIEEDLFIMDPRTIQEHELIFIKDAFKYLLKRV